MNKKVPKIFFIAESGSRLISPGCFESYITDKHAINRIIWQLNKICDLSNVNSKVEVYYNYGRSKKIAQNVIEKLGLNLSFSAELKHLQKSYTFNPEQNFKTYNKIFARDGALLVYDEIQKIKNRPASADNETVAIVIISSNSAMIPSECNYFPQSLTDVIFDCKSSKYNILKSNARFVIPRCYGCVVDFETKTINLLEEF